jgi:hypothetical protein
MGRKENIMCNTLLHPIALWIRGSRTPLIRFGLLAIGLATLLPVTVSFAQTATNLTNNTTPLVDVLTPAISGNTAVYSAKMLGRTSETSSR